MQGQHRRETGGFGWDDGRRRRANAGLLETAMKGQRRSRVLCCPDGQREFLRVARVRPAWCS